MADPVAARADAEHWTSLLGAGLTTLDGAAPADERQRQPVRIALADAAERHVSATQQLASGRTAQDFSLARRTALEGLHQLRAARIALGADPGPQIPAPDTAGHSSGTAYGSIDDSRRVVVDGQPIEAAGQPSDRTPYYYPGGIIGGRRVPAGWFSTPWWRTALTAGAAGLGTMLIIDALFGGPGMHRGALFGHHLPPGGPMGAGDPFGGPGGMDGLGDMGGDWF